MEGFLSTSLREDKGIEYSSNVILEITIKESHLDDDLDYGFAFLKEFSEYPFEEEVLINCFNVFQVKEVS